MLLTRSGDAGEVRSRKTLFQSGDLLYGKLRPYLDKAVLADDDGMCSTDILVLRTNSSSALEERAEQPAIDPYFLVGVLHSHDFVAHAVATTAGVNYPRTSWSAIKQFQLLLPPLSEQRDIARVLRAGQRAKDQTEQVISAAREFKRSLMRHLFSYGPVTSDEANVALTELGRIPEHWTVVALEDVQAEAQYAITAGPFGSKLGQKDYVSRGVPVLRGGNLVGGRKITLDGLVFVSEAKADELSASIARPGDVVVTQRGSLGLAALIPDDLPYQRYVVSQSQMKFTADRRKVLPEFVLYALQTEGALRRIHDSALRSGVPHINLSIFRAFKIPLPPLSDQEAIVSLLSAVDRKIEIEEECRAALDSLFQSLLHDLMTARLRVDGIVAAFAS